MRYSPLVLGALAVGQAAANNRHASFHARRHAADKRGDYDNVDWNKVDWKKVSYDLSGVDWDSVFGKKTSTSSTPAYTPPPAVKTSSTTPTPEPQTPTPTPTPVKTSSQAPQKSEYPSNPIDDIGDFLEDLFDGVEAWCDKVGIKMVGQNSQKDNGKMWIGKGSPWAANFINDGSEDGLLICWNDNGFTGMTINANQPMISIRLPVGKSQIISFAADQPAACSIMYSSTKLAMFGGVDNTWWEATYGQYGTFDVSRNVNMNGNSIHSKGSKCTSDMDTCVFKCAGGESSCTYGYDLYNCDKNNGGGGGYDVKMQGTGGGCSMAANSETVQVTFSN